jgi:hypothetical protein
MKIDLNTLDRENFLVTERELNGKVYTLVCPNHIGTKFTKENSIFRSSMWDLNGNLVSAGFKKFINLGEQPDVFGNPSEIGHGDRLENKLDGSLLIVSYIDGHLNCRTRGTHDAYIHENGQEINTLKEKYPKAFDDKLIKDGTCSFLFEWLSDTQKIVLSYPNCPDIRLLGVIDHADYHYFGNEALDAVSFLIGVSRPEQFKFDNLITMLSTVKDWKDREGVVWYHGNDMYKMKSAHYLFLHKLKSELSSLEKLMDVYLEQNEPDYTVFFEFISTTFDYELANGVRGGISNLCDARKEVRAICEGFDHFIEKIKPLPTRKDQALAIKAAYGDTNRASFLFTLLNGLSLDNEMKKKLYFQVMKK